MGECDKSKRRSGRSGLKRSKQKVAAQNERKAKLAQVKKDLYALFGLTDPQKRGKQLEDVLNQLFQTAGILVREAFTRVAPTGEGIVEQIDGVIELDGEIYLVEIKWWNQPLGTGEVSQHLVRVFSRNCARGLLISYSGFTDPAITMCKESLARMVVALCGLEEIVQILEREDDLTELLRKKVRAAIVDKNPYCRVYS